LFNNHEAVTLGEQCCRARTRWALKYCNDGVRHAEARHESSDLVSSDKHFYTKFGSDRRNPFSVSEGRNRCATSSEGPFNDEIAFS
jgi:hypothetical protein